MPLNERIIGKINNILLSLVKSSWIYFFEMEKVIDPNAFLIKLFYYLFLNLCAQQNGQKTIQITRC